MTKYHIGCSFGLAGDEQSDIIEAESLEEAEAEAWEWAMERLSAWAIPLEEDPEDE
jgi:hypothetical protein